MSWFTGKKKEKTKQYSGFPGDCSQQQLQALAKFKTIVHANKITTTQQYDDIYLLRFLRARKFDLPKTTKMWNDFIDWRVKNDIDNYKNLKLPQLPELRKLYPHGYHKVDKQFRPIYIERVGFMDVDKIFKVMETEQLLNYYAVLYETLLTTIFDGCSKARQNATGEHNKVTQTVTILDLKHIKLGNAGKAYDFVKPVSAMAQNNYPQILGNMFIVNAPMLFTGIWQIVKVWIDDKTKQKIKIIGGSYKKQLLQMIDPENLPAFLDGGKCTCGGKQCRLEANVGPWNIQGKEMFENNIFGGLNQQKQHMGVHKQQVLLSSPEVLVEVQAKDQLPLVLDHVDKYAQQVQVLQKVAQLDKQQAASSQQHQNDIKSQQQPEQKPEKPLGEQSVTDSVQTQEQKKTLKTEKVDQSNQTKDPQVTQTTETQIPVHKAEELKAHEPQVHQVVQGQTHNVATDIPIQEENVVTE